jgi:hypothetical protein
MMRNLLVTCGCIVGLVACDGSGKDPGNTFDPTATFNLSSNEDGDLCTNEGECFPNPCVCADAVIEVDGSTGETRETCLAADGTAVDSCDGLTACVTVTIPDPDCVVCAWVGGRVFYSSCVPNDEIFCEIIDRWGTGQAVGDAAVPGAEGAPAFEDPCAAGGTFPSDDGCNYCECLADGTVVCTERACTGCIPGETIPSPDGCNVCTCADDGSLLCTEMACGGTCRVCYDSLGNVVLDECGGDCSMVMCPAVLCGPGFELARLPNDCCDTCVPIDDCSQVACPDIALIGCPEGYVAVRIPGDCCGYACEPVDCANIACPAVVPECPDGFALVSGPPECCPRCEVVPNCSSDADCLPGEICSTSAGECRSSCDAAGAVCTDVCMGVCIPGNCPLDFVCQDGSLPVGPNCTCFDDVCLLDFICQDGSLPQGRECLCPSECLLDFICQDGSLPQGRDCVCPGASGDICYSDADCQSGVCSTSTGACDAPPGCEAGEPCITVCAGVCR